MTDYTNLRKIVTGDIIIKCRFGNEIRRIPINQVPTYDELCLMMYRVFKSSIQTSENIVLKYMDNEGDMISLLDDVDITHAISISSLLKVTVYDKSTAQQLHTPPSAEFYNQLVEMRDNLNTLIHSLKQTGMDDKSFKEEGNKTTRRLTPAELAEFLNDTDDKKRAGEEKASVSELINALSPGPTTVSTIPYYPPPASQASISQAAQPQAPPQPPVQQQHAPIQQAPVQQQPQAQQTPFQQQQQPLGQQQHQYQHQQRPLSMQQQPPPLNANNSQSSNYPQPQPNAYPATPNYPPPLQQQQQQPSRQGYYVPPPPSSINNTPHLPPQPYNPAPRW